jgi:hypothetical protein
MTLEQKLITAILTFSLWFGVLVVPDTWLIVVGRLLLLVVALWATFRLWHHEVHVERIWKEIARVLQGINDKLTTTKPK